MAEIKPSYSDLLDEMISLKGYKIIQEIELLKGTNYTFVRNFYELMETIREYEQDNEIWYLQNRQKLHLMQLEVLRLLHNFTSSVLTLIDHTRNFRKKIEEKKLDTTFKTEIKNLILNDVVIFMKQLRQYFQHYSLPVTNAQIHVTIIPGTENQYTEQQKLQLDVNELMKWTRWNRQSKRYRYYYLDIRKRCRRKYKGQERKECSFLCSTIWQRNNL